MRFGVNSTRFIALVLAILAGGVPLHPQSSSKLDPLLQQRQSLPSGESRIIVTVDQTLLPLAGLALSGVLLLVSGTALRRRA